MIIDATELYILILVCMTLTLFKGKVKSKDKWA